MRTLITGVTGFVGGHLVDYLLRAGNHDIHGTSRNPHSVPAARSGSILHKADPLDTESMLAVIEAVKPEWIFHLAGYAHNGRSFAEPKQAWAGNLTATQVLFDAIVRSKCKPRILITTTGLLYGDPESPGEIFDENSPFRPASPYAASKAAADLLSYQAWKQHGLQIIRARPFNQIGPGQSADYAAPNFARQVATIQAGKQPPLLETGNLAGQRDLTDVRDMVHAFVRLIELGQPGEAYNCASGTTYSMLEIVERLIHLTDMKIEVRQKIDAGRQQETLVSRASIDKLRAATGWAPVFSLQQTLKDILDDWRKR